LTESTISAEEERALRVLRELVLIPSSSQDDKKEIIEKVLRRLEHLGFRCETLGESDSPALAASIGRGGVMFSGHLDTVPLGEGWTRDQGEVRESILYGRGTADMKGGCAAMLMAAEDLAERGKPISLAFTTDEETKMKGAEHIMVHEIASEAPAIIVCEPTSMGMGAREKGLLQFRLTTSGKSAHAAMPDRGINANHRMLGALDRLKDMMSVPSNPMDSITLSIGVLRGGNKVNVIPDSCTAEVDIRTPATVQPEQVFAMVKEKIAGIDVSIQLMNQLSPILTPKDSTIVRLLEKIRPGIESIDIAYATEMVKYGKFNKNMLAIGPGDPVQAHVADEHIDVREVAEAAGLYRDICNAMNR
jgi:acetylornithine deacetylase/succinyl-diaminopimelate desuccinylase-like protein